MPTADHTCICTDVPCTPTPGNPLLPLPALELIGLAVYRAAGFNWARLTNKCMDAALDLVDVRVAATVCPERLIAASRKAVADRRWTSDPLGEPRSAAAIVGAGEAMGRWPADLSTAALTAIADEVSGPDADHDPALLAAISEGYEEGRAAGAAAITTPRLRVRTAMMRESISQLLEDHGAELAVQTVLTALAEGLTTALEGGDDATA